MKKAGFILAVLIACFALSLVVQNQKLARSRELNQLLSLEISALQDAVKTTKHENGLLSFHIESVEIEKKNLKDALQTAGFDIQKLKEREIKYRNLNNVLRASLESAGNLQTIVRDTIRVAGPDTIRYQKIQDFDNGYLSIFNASIENKQLNLSYRYKVGFDFFQHTHKNKTLVSVMITDPNAQITSASSITVTHKKKFYQKPWLWALAGFTSGILIAK